MTYSEEFFQPSLLDMAREGNAQAIAYWMNSLLVAQGVSVRVESSANRWLNIQVDFHQPKRKDECLSLQQRLVKFLCYRLWTLNSTAIHNVRITARQAGNRRVLWKQAVRILTPATEQLNRFVRDTPSTSSASSTTLAFRLARTLLLSRATATGFILCCWGLYSQLIGSHWSDGWLGTASLTRAPVASPDIAVPEVVSPETDSAPVVPPPPPEPIFTEPSFTNISVPEKFQGQIISQVEALAMPKVAALTFDDGPWPETTQQVLDILDREQIKATFFVVGQHIQNYPELLKKIVEAGHSLGNHTQHHYTHTLDRQTAAREIEETADLIFQMTGVTTKLFRPPGGNLYNGLADYAQAEGYGVMMWSADSEDYYVSTPTLIDKVLTQTTPGGIILLHDGGGDRSNTVEALPQIITALKQQGYQFVTIPELLEIESKQTPFNETEFTEETESIYQ